MAEELVDIVNEKDEVIGRAPKGEKIAKGFVSRNVAIFLADSEGNLIITRRAASKRSYPDRYDASACGNVTAGESYEAAAKRELLEELGIDCSLIFLGKIYNEFESEHRLRYFTGIFAGRWDGEARLLGGELSELRKMTVAEISELIARSPDLFTPGFVADFPVVKRFVLDGRP